MTLPLKITDWSPEYLIAHRLECNTILENLDSLKDIPLLNNTPLHNLKDGQVVKFMGMIQDMYDPEYYFQQYEVKNTQTNAYGLRCGMYADSAKCLPEEEILMDSEKNQNSERHTYIVISTPGLNSWVKENYAPLYCSHASATSSLKRSLIESNCISVEHLESTLKKGKCLLTTGEETTTILKHDGEQQYALSKDYILNFPIPMDDGKACIVKVYEDVSLKLNQVIEIIGFISLNPFLSIVHNSDETMTEAEMTVHHPPASLVPRLHAIKINPLVKHDIKTAPEIMSKAELIRTDLRLILSQLLFGDHLAADYLICHLLSSIYMRKDYFCLGAYALNITHFPVAKCKEFVQDLYKFLTLLIEKSHMLKITLDNLNDLTFSPKKDYECNRLNSGMLQLSDNTHLVMDETELTTGQITQIGRENYNTICNLINFQKVTYDFTYYKMEYETDIPILILSETKSFIPCQTQVALQIDSETERVYPQIKEMAEQYLKKEDRLSNIRQYLKLLRDTKFEFNDDNVIKEIQNDFTRLKEINRNADRLHTLMVLARLVSLSYGSNTLTTEYWKKAVQMEFERLNRLPQKKKV